MPEVFNIADRPGPCGPYTHPLLAPVRQVHAQQAGMTLRAWHRVQADPCVARDIAPGGLPVRTHDLATNNAPGRRALVSTTLETADAAERRVVLMLFGDNSALVLRADGAAQDRLLAAEPALRALPAVLKLRSTYTPTDPTPPALRLQMRKSSAARRSRSAVLALSRKDGGTGWVSREASHAGTLDGITPALRAALTAHLLAEACAWAATIPEVPALRIPAADPLQAVGAPHGFADAAAALAGAPPCPAAFAQSRFTAAERDRMSAFLTGVGQWLLVRIGESALRIQLEILASQPHQVPATPDAPQIRAAISPAGRQDAAGGGARLDRIAQEVPAILQRILAGGVAPVAPARLIGQCILHHSGDLSSSIATLSAGCAHAHRDRLPGQHALLALRARLDPYWPEYLGAAVP